jgi:hypothetical protein
MKNIAEKKFCEEKKINQNKATTIYELVFLAGLLRQELKVKSEDSCEIDIKEVKTSFVLKIGQPEFIGEKGEKKYKLTLERFNEKLLLLKVIEVTKGVGHVVVKKIYKEERTESKEITIFIKK